MALAVGAMALPWLIGAAADHAGGSIGQGLRALSRELRPCTVAGHLADRHHRRRPVAVDGPGRRPGPESGPDRSWPTPRLLMGALRGVGPVRAALDRWLGIVPARPLILYGGPRLDHARPRPAARPGLRAEDSRSGRPGLVPRVGKAPDPRWLGPIAALLLVNGAGLASHIRGAARDRWATGSGDSQVGRVESSETSAPLVRREGSTDPPCFLRSGMLRTTVRSRYYTGRPFAEATETPSSSPHRPYLRIL